MAENAVPKDFLTLFEGKPFDWDPFTDCKVVFNERVFHCHRSVLARTGTGFRAQLTSVMDGTNPNVFHVSLPTVPLNNAGVEAFMVALYKPGTLGDIADVSILSQVCRLLDYYGAQRTLQQCAARLVLLISNENVRDVLMVATECNIEELIKPCLDQIGRFPAATFEEPDWEDFAQNNPHLMLPIIQRLAHSRDKEQRAVRSLEIKVELEKKTNRDRCAARSTSSLVWNEAMNREYLEAVRNGAARYRHQERAREGGNAGDPDAPLIDL